MNINEEPPVVVNLSSRMTLEVVKSGVNLLE